jgi:hypothetical protein
VFESGVSKENQENDHPAALVMIEELCQQFRHSYQRTLSTTMYLMRRADR